MRLFYAILFDEKFLKILENNQSLLKEHGITGKFVNREKLHLTLKFLGEVEEGKLDLLKKIEQPCGIVSPFNVQLGRLGVFPPKGRPRVLWQGLEGTDKADIEKFDLLKKLLDESLYELGYEKDKRKFKPHITLARDPRNIKKEYLNSIPVEKIESYVDSFSLMSSELTKNGPIYTELYRYELFRN